MSNSVEANSEIRTKFISGDNKSAAVNEQEKYQVSAVSRTPSGDEVSRGGYCNDYDHFLDSDFFSGDVNNSTSSSKMDWHHSPLIELYYDLPNNQLTQQQHPLSARMKSHSSSNILLMRRVSSGFFSVGSMGSTTGEISDGAKIATSLPPTTTDDNSTRYPPQNMDPPVVTCNAVDVLYHDIMMNVLSYLPLQDLSSYSQTAKRPNIDCHDYLKLQLELALLLPTNHSNNNNNDSGNTPAAIMSRLASLDLVKAEQLVEKYRETVRVDSTSNNNNDNNRSNPFLKLQHEWNNASIPEKVATTMFGISMLGATAASKAFTSNAALVGSSACNSSYTATFGTACACVSFAAARYYINHNDSNANHGNASNNTASNSTHAYSSRMLVGALAQKLQALLMTVPHQDEEGILPEAIANHLRRLQSPTDTTSNPLTSQHEEDRNDQLPETSTTSPRRKRRGKHTRQAHCVNNCNEPALLDNDQEVLFVSNSRVRRRPVGCVGMYMKALKEAKECVTHFLLEKRCKIFDSLSIEAQRNAITAFIDACSDDDQIESLKSLVVDCGVNVNGFFVGSDIAANNANNNNNIASETCALHAAAFHGSTSILEFLCQGVATSSEEEDGGLCDVNIVDANGWSALHFAAGCFSDNGVTAVQILARNGCNLFHEAGNGYTPYHWAQRLSNLPVAEELKRLGADSRFVVHNMELKSILMCSASAAIPLSFFANRVLHGNHF